MFQLESCRGKHFAWRGEQTQDTTGQDRAKQNKTRGGAGRRASDWIGANILENCLACLCPICPKQTSRNALSRSFFNVLPPTHTHTTRYLNSLPTELIRRYKTSKPLVTIRWFEGPSSSSSRFFVCLETKSETENSQKLWVCRGSRVASGKKLLNY